MQVPRTSGERPRLRGRLHQFAFFVSLPAGASLVTLAQSFVGRVAVGIYAASLTALYAASAALHRVPWRAPMLRWMRSLDYSAIFLLIASSYTAFTLLTLEGPWAVATLAVAWTVAAVGALLKLLRVDGFRVLVPILYLGLGWFALILLPLIVGHLGMLRLSLTVAGGALYTLGFVVLTVRRPDPVPHVFGYFELWHAMVIAASACHFTVITLLAIE